MAWRHLLRAQPHDSISGCSVDQVHRDMRHRFDVAREIGERIGQEALAALAGAGRDAVWHWAGAPGLQRTLVNVLPWPRRCAVALPVPPRRRFGPGVQVLRDGTALVVADLPAFGSVPVDLVAGAPAPRPPRSPRRARSRTASCA